LGRCIGHVRQGAEPDLGHAVQAVSLGAVMDDVVLG
jgi:hypothetical protein